MWDHEKQYNSYLQPWDYRLQSSPHPQPPMNSQYIFYSTLLNIFTSAENYENANLIFVWYKKHKPCWYRQEDSINLWICNQQCLCCCTAKLITRSIKNYYFPLRYVYFWALMCCIRMINYAGIPAETMTALSPCAAQYECVGTVPRQGCNNRQQLHLYSSSDVHISP